MKTQSPHSDKSRQKTIRNNTDTMSSSAVKSKTPLETGCDGEFSSSADRIIKDTRKGQSREEELRILLGRNKEDGVSEDELISFEEGIAIGRASKKQRTECPRCGAKLLVYWCEKCIKQERESAKAEALKEILELIDRHKFVKDDPEYGSCWTITSIDLMIDELKSKLQKAGKDIYPEPDVTEDGRSARYG